MSAAKTAGHSGSISRRWRSCPSTAFTPKRTATPWLAGPYLIDLLGAVGAPAGEALRGKNLALYVRVSAADGYRAVFALAELDPDLRSDVPIVTASCNGNALDAKDGPFRLVVPGEKRPARWVRQVTAVDLLRAP